MSHHTTILLLLTFTLTLTLCTVVPARRPKVILDVDPGVDDAHALLMMLSQSDNHTILALTVSQGNTYLSNATHNALRVLRLCDKLSIPVYLGTQLTLDGQVKTTSVYFGPNGFGNVPDDTFDYSPYLNQPENASQALIRLVTAYPNEITLIALGTQTNIAIAMQNDVNFGKNLKDCFIMGGNYLGIGNESPRAEFNFLVDPKAANVVISGLQTDITIITWELCLNHSVTWTWYDSWVTKGTTKSNFIKLIGQFGRDRATTNNEVSHLFADQLAVGVYLNPSIIEASQQIVARVETINPSNVGEMIVDWDSQAVKKNIRLVTEVNIEEIKAILDRSV